MSPVRVTTRSARTSADPIDIVIVDKNDGGVVERVSLVRYAGHYRVDAIDAFVVRDSGGKVRVRSEDELGLAEHSAKVAYVADSFVDLRSA